MLFKIICLCIFALSNLSVLNFNRENDNNDCIDMSSENFGVDSSGLYDQDIRELYNSTKKCRTIIFKR